MDNSILVVILFIVIVVFAFGRLDMMQLLGVLAIAALVLRTQKRQTISITPDDRSQLNAHNCSTDHGSTKSEISFCGGNVDEPKPIDVYEGESNAKEQPQSSPKEPSLRYNKQNPYPWGSNPQYTGCYPEVPYDLGKCNTGAYLPFDEANARLAALRQRDKKVLDGYVTKNANYYKRHFSTELDEAEAKRWWGDKEY